jgi:hypothetical protein
LKNILIASLFMVMTIAPWTYRNWRILHAWVPVSTNGGDNFYRANNPLATGNWTPRGERLLPTGDEVVANHIGFQWGKEWWREQLLHHPRTLLRITARKIYMFWQTDEDVIGDGTGYRHTKFWSAQLIWIALLLLTARSIYRGWRNINLWLLLLPVALLGTVHAVFESQQRYHIPAIPFLIIVAAIGLLPRVKKSLSAPLENSADRDLAA